MDSGTIEQQMKMTEQAIGRTFVDNGLPIHLLSGIQGPHTFTFGLRLYRPTAANLNKALRLDKAVEANLGDGPIRITIEQGVVWVETPSPWPVNVPGRQLQGKGLATPLGLTSRRVVTGVDFGRDPHLLLVGPTGRGKTTAARAVAFHLARQNRPNQVRLLAVTFKPADWQAFRQLRHTLAVITNAGDAGQLLDWLRTLMHRRSTAGQYLPRLVLFLDDLLNLLALADVTGSLSEIASLGRAAGIHLVIGTQRLGKRGAGDAAITGNVPVRLVFGTADAQDASFFTGRGKSGAEALGRYKGDALLVSDGGTIRLAVSPVSDDDLAALPQDAREMQPWRQAKEPLTVPATGADLSVVPRENLPVPPGFLPAQPFLDRAPETAAEIARIRQIYAETGSKSRTCRLVWGYKNGEVWRWLKAALEE